MKLLTSVLLFSVGALAHSGWTIPRDDPAGVYNVVVDASGNSKHVLVRDLSASTKSALSDARTIAPRLSKGDLSKRESKGSIRVHCQDYKINATDTNAAVVSLETQCADGAFIKKGDSLYAKIEDVVVYFCNLSDSSKVCNRDEVKDKLEKISGVCGNFVAGYHEKKGEERIGYVGSEDSKGKICNGRKIKEDD